MIGKVIDRSDGRTVPCNLPRFPLTLARKIPTEPSVLKKREGERESWQITRDGATVASIYNLSYHASPARDTLCILSAEDGKTYEMRSVRQYLRIGRFGGLIKHISPVRIRSDGAIMRFVDRRFSMTDGEERYTVSGEALRGGVSLAMQYSGTGYDPKLRILGDFGSTMYTVGEIPKGQKEKL